MNLCGINRRERGRVRTGESTQLRQHPDSAHGERFSPSGRVVGDDAQHDASVENGTAFHGRAPGDGVESSLVCIAHLPGSLRDVQRDGERRTLQLVRKLPVTPRETGSQLPGHSEELDREAVDVELLVAEHVWKYRQQNELKCSQLLRNSFEPAMFTAMFTSTATFTR